MANEAGTNYPVDGVWYPRAGTLGGCTAHNAMITITPQDRDWDAIATFTNDSSWRADNMHQYFERLENCTYRPRPGSLRYMLDTMLWRLSALVKGRKGGDNSAHGHGFDGWLTTSAADPRVILTDKALTLLLINSVKEVLARRPRRSGAHVLHPARSERPAEFDRQPRRPGDYTAGRCERKAQRAARVPAADTEGVWVAAHDPDARARGADSVRRPAGDRRRILRGPASVRGGSRGSQAGRTQR